MVPFNDVVESDMVLEFRYLNKKGEVKNRKVFVVRECDSCLEGLDLLLLNENETKEITRKFGDLKPSHSEVRTGGKIDGWDVSWNRAWRRFNKSGII